MLFDIIAAIIVGGVAGWLASMLLKTNEEMGWVGNVIIGIIGAFIGNFIARYTGLFGGDVTDFSIGSILTAFIGAVILLAIVKAVSPNNRLV